MWDYLHASTKTLFYIMFSITNTMKKQTLLCHFPSSHTKKVPIWPWSPPSLLFVATPLKVAIKKSRMMSMTLLLLRNLSDVFSTGFEYVTVDSEVFNKKSVLKNFAIFTRKHVPVSSLTILKASFVNLAKLSKTTYFVERLETTVFVDL